MRSLYRRIIGYFLVIIIATVGVFETFSYFSLKDYFYSAMSGVITGQARYNTELYRSYFSDYSLEDVVRLNRDQFYRNNRSQVQLLNNNGQVIFDSSATSAVGKFITTPDVQSAMTGKGETSIHYTPYTDEQVMSVSYPLIDRAYQVGIIRLTTSLEQTNRAIRNRFLIFLLFGLIVILLAFFASLIMAHSVIQPINSLTEVAKKLANGQFDVRAEVHSDDEIGKLAQTLNFMSMNIMEKDALKSDFISSVSHELRTPLTAIRGWAITLEGEDYPEGSLVPTGLRIIETESDRLSAMVEDLLDFSRLTSGRLSIIKQENEIIELANNIVRQMMPRAKEGKISLLFDYTRPEIHCVCDADRIKQVLINLLDNALKFTPEEGVVVLKVYEDRRNVYMDVTDTGCGIDEGEINIVTEKFYKGMNSASHVGLGLSICEEIVKGHDGDLQISSVIDEGTTVTVRLPKESGS